MNTEIQPAKTADHAAALDSPRLSMLELSEALKQMREAFQQRRQHNSGERNFEQWKKRYQQQGIAALKDVVPANKTHPHATAPEVVEKIIALSLQHPGWGCVRLSAYLKGKSISVSSPTIQNFLIKEGMGSKRERLQLLEHRFLNAEMQLSAEQTQMIETYNPCFRERALQVSKPGELLLQDAFYLGHVPGLGKCYMHAVLDVYSNYAFGFVHTLKKAESAVVVLHNDVLPFYGNCGIPIQTIETDADREFCGDSGEAYQAYMAFNDMTHRVSGEKKNNHGYMLRFRNSMLDEFSLQGYNDSPLSLIQADAGKWLQHYNQEHAHQGFPNRGETPAALVDQWLAIHQRDVA